MNQDNFAKQACEISLMICTRMKDEGKRREYEEQVFANLSALYLIIAI